MAFWTDRTSQGRMLCRRCRHDGNDEPANSVVWGDLVPMTETVLHAMVTAMIDHRGGPLVADHVDERHHELRDMVTEQLSPDQRALLCQAVRSLAEALAAAPAPRKSSVPDNGCPPAEPRRNRTAG